MRARRLASDGHWAVRSTVENLAGRVTFKHLIVFLLVDIAQAFLPSNVSSTYKLDRTSAAISFSFLSGISRGWLRAFLVAA